MGDGTKENPYTREDVLKLIEENRGTTREADLLKSIFGEAHLWGAHLEGADLKDVDLEGANLEGAHLEGAHLESANLEGANLASAHLEGTHLENANLEGANLEGAHLEGAYLGAANLEGTYLGDAQFSPETKLAEADWGNFILGEERELQFGTAVDTYRQLKTWHANAGYSDIAAKFYYLEKEASRKSLKLFSKDWRHRIALQLSYWVFGHGERWERILIWMAGVILLFALTYYAIGSVWEWSAFWKSLYFSAVSFTALGYGEWVHLDNDLTSDIIRGLGAFESFIGVFTIALLLVTFVRKWTR